MLERMLLGLSAFQLIMPEFMLFVARRDVSPKRVIPHRKFEHSYSRLYILMTYRRMAGQEGVNAVYSPMAKTMEDLTYFMRAVVKMEPWRYDHSVHPLPWRAVDKKWRLVPESDKETSRRRKVRFGVIRDDGKDPDEKYLPLAVLVCKYSLVTRSKCFYMLYY